MVSNLEFKNVNVVPYEFLINNFEKFHQGGPIWHDFETQTVARHCRGQKPCDSKPEYLNPLLTVDKPCIWLGPVTNHFGHQIYDFSGRIAPSIANGTKDCNYIVGIKKGSSVIPKVSIDILNWFNVNLSKVEVVACPTTFRSISVFGQIEQPFTTPKLDYLNYLDDLTRINLGNIKKTSNIVYVSRSKIHAHIAGESYIEELMLLEGIKIIHPQELSLKDQLSTYCSADLLIFSEGSALHGLQLLGTVKSKVVIINRRQNFKMGMKDFLHGRCNSVHYIDSVSDQLAIITDYGKEHLTSSLALINYDSLLVELKNQGVNLWRNFKLSDFHSSVEKDIHKWLKRNLEIGHLRNKASIENINRVLGKYNFTINFMV